MIIGLNNRKQEAGLVVGLLRVAHAQRRPKNTKPSGNPISDHLESGNDDKEQQQQQQQQQQQRTTITTTTK